MSASDERSGQRVLVVCVGTELVNGAREDENGPYLVRAVREAGYQPVGRLLIADSRQQVARTLAGAVRAGVELVLVTGGLGLTVDDVTREGIAEGLGCQLELDPQALEWIQQRYDDRGREMPEGAQRQALRPEGGRSLANPLGAAPAFQIERGSTLLVAMPGVPREVEAILQRSVLPLLRSRQAAGTLLPSIAHLLVVGLGENTVQAAVESALPEVDPSSLAFYAGAYAVELVIELQEPGEESRDLDFETLVQRLHSRLGAHLLEATCVGCEGVVDQIPSPSAGDPLVRKVRDELLSRGWNLGVAESCTGGMLASRIADLPGASAFFSGAVVAYANEEKQRLLGVTARELNSCGAVSAAVAQSMAEGCRKKLNVDFAISTTGIAGPEGGTPDKPVGLLFVGVSDHTQTRVCRHVIAGDRQDIRTRATTAALDEARRLLSGHPPLGELIRE